MNERREMKKNRLQVLELFLKAKQLTLAQFCTDFWLFPEMTKIIRDEQLIPDRLWLSFVSKFKEEIVPYMYKGGMMDPSYILDSELYATSSQMYLQRKLHMENPTKGSWRSKQDKEIRSQEKKK